VFAYDQTGLEFCWHELSTIPLHFSLVFIAAMQSNFGYTLVSDRYGNLSGSALC